MTFYGNTGSVYNRMNHNGQEVSSVDITHKPDKAHYKDETIVVDSPLDSEKDVKRKRSKSVRQSRTEPPPEESPSKTNCQQ